MEKNKEHKGYLGRAATLNMAASEGLRNRDIMYKPEGKEGESHEDIQRETIPRRKASTETRLH